MKRFFKGSLLVTIAALFIVAGYAAGYHQLSLKNAGSLIGPSVACAHTGGECYLDDTNIGTVERGCYSKCQRTYKVQIETSACEVGCSMAMDVATRRR